MKFINRMNKSIHLFFGTLITLYLSGCSTPFTELAVPAYANSKVISKIPDGGLVQLDTRRGVTVDVLVFTTEDANANVILLEGGDGIIDFDSAGDIINDKKDNFLVRNRKHFLQHNMNVFLVDAPSDHRRADRGMLWGFRAEKAHLKDLSYVLSLVREKASGLPIYVIGSDKGTESAMFMAIYFPHALKGVVLASPTTENDEDGDPVSEYELEHLKIPLVLIGHKDDRCEFTDTGNIQEILEKAENSDPKLIAMVDGGVNRGQAMSIIHGRGQGNPKLDYRNCTGKSFHQFWRADIKALDVISGFIKK